MRDIVHLNIAHFAATVEQAAQPALRRCPIIVSLQSRGRSFVYDVSAEAWLNGVDRGISLSAARRRLPKAVVVPARPAIYRRAAQSLYRLAGEFSPLVEPAPRGHLFLDITGMYSLYGASVDLAARLKRECRSRLGLDPGIGLASSKLVSKVATRVVKPFGFASVPGGSETGFLGPQPVTLLPGVGDALSHRMTALGIVTLGDLSLLPDDLAMAAFGRPGMRFRDFARGIDGTPVTGRGMHELPVKVIKEFASDSSDLEELEIHLHGLIEEAGFRLRQRNLTACRVRLFLGYTD
ncbi:MAG: hypothetical protein QGH40_17925, partial [bacterium]|nr:hypothetical protein [bacterium]